MSFISKEQWFKGTLSLATLASIVLLTNDTATAVSVTGTLGVVKKLFSQLAPNWAAQFSIDAIMPSIQKKWLNEPDSKLNHHINLALLSAWNIALDEVITEYLQSNNAYNSEDKKTLRKFLATLKTDAKEEFLTKLDEDDNNEEIFAFANSADDLVWNYLDERFSLTTKFNQYYSENQFAVDFQIFFKERLTALTSFYFRIELKKGKEAKHAIDLLYQETLRQSVSLIGDNQDEQLRILSSLQSTLASTNEFEREMLDSLSEALGILKDQVVFEISAIRRDVGKIISKLTIKPFLSYNDESDEPDLSTLFSYKQKYTPFSGREDDLVRLQDFVNDERNFCWLAITGPGGIGKSRLALEITEITRTQGFHSGFLNVGKLFPWESWLPEMPTFIVIDYAFADYEKVFTLLELLRQKDKQKEIDCKVRILLLDRDLREDWLNEISVNDAIRNSNFLKASGQKYHKLSALTDSGRWKIISDIIFRSDLPFENKQVLFKQEQQILKKLQIWDPENRPLFAFFAGVALSHALQLNEVLEWDVDDLIQHHLNRLELDVWSKTPGFKKKRSGNKKLILLNTFCREIRYNQLSLVISELDLDSEFVYEHYSLIVETVKDPYGNIEKFLGLQPDILGELFLMVSMQGFADDLPDSTASWTKIKNLAIELNVRGVDQTIQLLKRDFSQYSDFETAADANLQLIRRYSSLIAGSPTNHIYYTERGTCKLHIGLKAEAILDFNSSISIAPDRNICYAYRAMCRAGISGADMNLSVKDLEIALRSYPDWELLYEYLGDIFKALGDNESAIRNYDRCIAINEHAFSAYQKKANLLYEIDSDEECLNVLNVAIELGLDSVYNFRGNVNFSLERYEDAVDDYTLAIETLPEAICFLNRGDCYRMLGLEKEALNDFERALTIDPIHAKAILQLCDLKFPTAAFPDPKFFEKLDDLLMDAFDKENALFKNGPAPDYTQEDVFSLGEFADQSIKTDLPNASLFFLRGFAKIFTDQFHFEDVMSDLDAAISLDPFCDHFFQYRARYRARYGMYELAEEDFRKAIELNNTNPLNYIYYGIMMGNAPGYCYMDKLHIFDQAIIHGADMPEFWYQRGILNTSYEKWEAAITDYDQAIILKRNAAKYFVARGTAKLGSKKFEYQEILTDFDRGILLDAQTSRFYHERARLHLTHKRFEAAEDDYDKAISMEPNYDLYLEKAIISFQQDNFTKAEEIFSMAISHNSKQDPQCNFYRGICRLKLNRLQEAEVDFLSALNCDPEYYYALSELGDVYLQLKDDVRAYEYLKKALKNKQTDYNQKKLCELFEKQIQIRKEHFNNLIGVASTYDQVAASLYDIYYTALCWADDLQYNFEHVSQAILQMIHLEDKVVYLSPIADSYYELKKPTLTNLTSIFSEVITRFDFQIEDLLPKLNVADGPKSALLTRIIQAACGWISSKDNLALFQQLFFYPEIETHLTWIANNMLPQIKKATADNPDVKTIHFTAKFRHEEEILLSIKTSVVVLDFLGDPFHTLLTSLIHDLFPHFVRTMIGRCISGFAENNVREVDFGGSDFPEVIGKYLAIMTV